MVYLLKSNLNHVLELKCDISLISNLSEEQRISYLEGVLRIVKLGRGSISRPAEGCASMVSVEGKKLEQRFKIVLEYKKPNWKSKLSRVLFYIIMAALLFLSFLFILQPYKGYYTNIVDTRLIETNGEERLLNFVGYTSGSYIVMNMDGTYSVYIDGKFVKILDQITDGLKKLPIIQKQEE